VNIDSNGEFVDSCSDDGTMVISSLYANEKEKFDYQQRMKTIIVDLEYSQRNSRQFVAKGLVS
jgi:hypothetical protein